MIFPRCLIVALALTYCDLAVAVLASPAAAQTITLGETALLGFLDSGNGNLLAAQGPYPLAQAATIQSLSFYVVNPGLVRLGIYDSGPNNDCTGGTLRAQTNPFNTVGNSWNTANVITPVPLPAGNYCLAYLPSSNSLSFRKGLTTGIGEVNYYFAFGPMPAIFSRNPGGDPFHWSFYATLTGAAPPPPTLQLSFNPPNPSVAANARPGTVVTAIQVNWSNSQPFTGTVGFGPPYGSDGGVFAIDGNLNIIVASTGPGLAADTNTIQQVTIVAAQ
jgi:hypothetical protein